MSMPDNPLACALLKEPTRRLPMLCSAMLSSHTPPLLPSASTWELAYDDKVADDDGLKVCFGKG